MILEAGEGESTMSRTRMALLLLVLASTSAFGLELKQNKPQTLKFRIAAVTEHVRRSGTSPNRETYLVYVLGTDDTFQNAKVVFRYLGFEDPLSQEFDDFGLVHSFKALRDPSCDESFHSFSTKLVAERNGNLRTVTIARYVSPDAVQDIAEDQILPCYVITPQSYKGSKPANVGHANSLTGDGK